MADQPYTTTDLSDEYETYSSEAVGVSRALPELYKRLGSPQDPTSEPGQKMMKVLIAVWRDMCPHESLNWLESRKDYQNTELSISEQVSKSTGRSLASYPLPLFKMMKLFFPDYKFSDLDSVIKFVKVFPMFRMARQI